MLDWLHHELVSIDRQSYLLPVSDILGLGEQIVRKIKLRCNHE